MPRREFGAALEKMRERKRVGKDATLAGSDGDDDIEAPPAPGDPEVDWLTSGVQLYMPKPQAKVTIRACRNS